MRYRKLNNPGGRRRGWWERRRRHPTALLFSLGQWRIELKVGCYCSIYLRRRIDGKRGRFAGLQGQPRHRFPRRQPCWLWVRRLWWHCKRPRGNEAVCGRGWQRAVGLDRKRKQRRAWSRRSRRGVRGGHGPRRTWQRRPYQARDAANTCLIRSVRSIGHGVEGRKRLANQTGCHNTTAPISHTPTPPTLSAGGESGWARV